MHKNEEETRVGRRDDEICYPFMAEEGMFCDYEILTDGLSSQLGLCHAHAGEVKDGRLGEDLLWLVEMALHLNGSVRGKLAVDEADLEALHGIYDRFRGFVPKAFTLPVGSVLSCELHLARHRAKEVVRMLHKIDGAPEILIRFAGLLANLLYAMSCYAERQTGSDLPVFVSKSYAMSGKE